MKTEKDLDNLFKNGLEEPGNYMHYREEDWSALEEMLDERKERRGIVYWLPILSGVAALLILAFGWYFINRGSEKNHTPQIAGAGKHHIESSKPGHIDAAKPSQVIPGTSGRPIQQQVVLNNKFGLPAKGDPGAGSNHNRSFLALSAEEAGRGTAGKNILATNRHPEALTALDQSAFDADGLSNAVTFDKLNSATANKTAPLPNNKKITKNNEGFGSRMALTALASPTMNGVNSFSQSEFGGSFGLLFSVGISRKFTISTGAIYAKTPYTTDFYNYHAGYKFRTDPETVNADCRILDVPLDIDYQLLAKGKNKFSVGSGLSSYIMLRENYHYNYAVQGTPGPSNFNVINKNKHFMGVLNLDATYQRQLSSKFSLAVQPYLKVPLTDIGNGEVKLQSTGLAVGVSWHINTQKR